MGSDVYDAALELVNETEQLLKVVLLPNAYGWPERHEGVNSRGRQFIAAWNEVQRLWDPDLEGRLAGRRTDPVAFRDEVLAGCWLRVAKDVGLRVLAVLQRLHESQLGRLLVLKVRPTPRAEPEAPILAFSAEHVPAIVERFGQEPAFTWQEPPELLAAAIRRDFAPLIVGIRQEQAWAGAPAPPAGDGQSGVHVWEAVGEVGRTFGFDSAKRRDTWLRKHNIPERRPLTKDGKEDKHRREVDVLAVFREVAKDAAIANDPVRAARIQRYRDKLRLDKDLEDAATKALLGK